ncbi:MAG TPA: hypothetical protein VJ464_25890 [Blastocatellia bacterium]|nr:hypothetical protein [Blastocatellia bacterium]
MANISILQITVREPAYYAAHLIAMASTPFSDYLEYLGFSEGQNPFVSVNARDERAVLEGYFVPPPYFETLWGSPLEPNSAVITAPTGGGKTALAVMIDERASSLELLPDGRFPVLVVLYDDFSHLGLHGSKQGLEDHFAALNYLLAIHALSNVALSDIPHMRISPEERGFLRYCFAKYIGGRAHAEVTQDLEKIRTPWERFQRTTDKVVKALPLISTIAQLLELGVERLEHAVKFAEAIIRIREETRSFEATPEVDFYRLIEFLSQYFGSVYILVDRVDETPWTQRDAEATYNLIHPLVANLNLLDRPERRYAFKFFLWDGVKQFYRQYARDDRIFIRDLDWNPEQLVEMLDKRVSAFSDEKVKSVQELFEPDLSFTSVMPVSEMLSLFAGTSPRSMVTLCKYMVEEELNFIQTGDGKFKKIGERAVIEGLNKFASEVAHRLILDDKARREITSIGRVVFTSKSLNSDVFRGQTPQSVQSKVGKWKRFEVFKTIDNEITGTRGFPTEIQAFTEPCVAYLASGLPLKDFLASKVRRCSNCGTILLRDFERGGNFKCGECLTNFELPKLTTEDQEMRQATINKLAREVTKNVADPLDIRALCKAANVPFGDSSFTGQPFLIWLRTIQVLEESDIRTLKTLLEVLDGALPKDSRAKELLDEFYYNLPEE